MFTTHPYDRISMTSLQARRAGVKWTHYPDKLGAFVAEMDFGCAPVIQEALHEAVDAAVFGYVPHHLIQRMSTACAGWIARRHGWEIDAEAIHAVPDVLRGLQIVIEHFTPADGAIVVPTPAYMPFLTIPETLGREVIEVPMLWDGRDYAFDLPGLAAAFEAGGGLLILCNPSNPLGVVFDEEELTAVAEVVQDAGVRVFADEIHAPLIYSGRRHIPYASVSEVTSSHSITATSASKGWNLPGLKCAQIITTNAQDTLAWATLPRVVTHGVANLGLVATAAAYESGTAWLDDVLTYLQGSRDYLRELVAEQLPLARFRNPDATYMAWLDLRDCGLGRTPAAELFEKANLAVTEGPLCGAGNEGFVRLNFATPRPILREIIERIGTLAR